MINRLLLLSYFFFSSLLLLGQNTTVKQLEEELQSASSNKQKILLLLQLAETYQDIDLSKALVKVETSISISSELKDTNNLLRGYLLQMHTLHLMGKNQDVLKLSKNVLNEIKISKNTNRLIQYHSLMGEIYNATEQFDLAINSALKSIELAKFNKNLLEEGIGLMAIGNMYKDKFNYPKAKEYYKKAENIFLEGNYRTELIKTYLALSSCNLPFEEGIKILSKAEQLSREFGNNKMSNASLNFKLGNTYAQNYKYEEAIPYYLQAIQIWQITKYPKGLQAAYENLASCYAEIQDKQNALINIRKAQEVIQQTEGTLRDSMLSFYFVGEVYGTLGIYDSAYHYWRHYIALADELLYNKGSEELMEMEVKYQTAEKERQIAQQELKLLEEQKAKNNLYFILVGLFLLGGSLFYWYKNLQQNKKQQIELALEKEQLEKEKIKELDDLKSNFFANISHEFRTPLTLILGPLKDLRRNKVASKNDVDYASMERNANRLLQLVNQLLDLSKVEVGKMKLAVSEGEIVKFVRTISMSFQSLAVVKQVDFQTNFPIKEAKGYFDKDKLEKIITNLLSNSFKFTPKNGKVSINLTILDNQLILSVKDTGIGIPQSQINQIFDRFYQVNQTKDQLIGTGIGLALTKELVELHKGSIAVESEAGVGSQFIVKLPIESTEFSPSEIKSIATPTITTSEINIYPDSKIKEEITINPEKTTVLIVEDNADLSNYIATSVQGNYQILRAENGKKGLDLAQEHLPNLIITDVMMPEMDGHEFTQKVRKSELTSHIPLIMLTAKSEQKDKLFGLGLGVDAYLTKPFDSEELRLRVDKLIEQRKQLQVRYSQVVTLKPTELQVDSIDEQFLKNVMEIVEANLEEETFGVEVLEKQIGMSRSQLYRKIKALTDKSPSVFIRTMRLHRAKNLLEQQACTASEAAYQFGFSSLPYFTKCFKEEFGMPPSQLKNKKN